MRNASAFAQYVFVQRIELSHNHGLFFPLVSSKMHKRWSHSGHTDFEGQNVKL